MSIIKILKRCGLSESCGIVQSVSYSAMNLQAVLTLIVLPGSFEHNFVAALWNAANFARSIKWLVAFKKPINTASCNAVVFCRKCQKRGSLKQKV